MDYLKNAISIFKNYKSMADKSIAQVTNEQLFWQPNETSNSIAIIVKHMAGNMISRWTDFLTTDGEKEWRDRNSEFEISKNEIKELIAYWERGWNVLFNALESLTEEDLDKIVFIRKEPHKVFEALNRQIAHYAYHTGQIVYVAKLIADENWNTLSIPRGKSKEFDAEKFK